jgi:3-oxoacyl-[acyl-carrier protein] reductase
VVFTGRRAELAAEHAARFPGCAGVRSDLTSVSAAGELHTAAVDAVGPLDIVVLNGPGPTPGPAAELDPAATEGALRSLLLVHQALLRLALPHMRTTRWGRILAIGSRSVVAPIPNLALSNLGRAALAGYLKTLAAEVAADGVTVNMLLPGRIATDRLRAVDEADAARTGRTVDEVRARATEAIPVGRDGDPAEFGSVAAFMCGAPASYITGVALRCDGGITPVL